MRKNTSTTTILLSPTETDLIKLLPSSIISILPEEKGADILLYTKMGLIGIQRKSIPYDFISSIEDGRMSRSTTLLGKSCPIRIVVCEGKFRYYQDGKLDLSNSGCKSRYTKDHIRGMLFNIRYVKNVEVDWTEDISDTAEYIKQLSVFFNKTTHLGLYTRPSAKSPWGKPSDNDLALWLLQSFEGIGPQLASNILRHFDRLPIRWDCMFEELVEVKGLSRKRVEEIWKGLGEGHKDMGIKRKGGKGKVGEAGEVKVLTRQSLTQIADLLRGEE